MYTIKAFGSNGFGKLGLNGPKEVYTPTTVTNVQAKQISAGCYHSVAIDMQNNVWLWGYNGHGQLGLGHFQDTTVPTQIPFLKAKKFLPERFIL